MVRLLHLDFCPACRAASEFQSHNGAIAAREVYERLSRLPEFQSHNGAIAAEKHRTTYKRLDMFQSHNGAIAAKCFRCFRFG